MSTEVCKIEKGRDHAKNLHLKVLTMYMGGCYHRDIEIKQYINDISIFIVRFAVRRFTMRRRISLLVGVLFACALCACSAQNVGDSGSQAASSAPVSSAPSENNLPESTAAPAVSDSQPSAPAESTAASSDINSDATSSADSQSSEETYTLTRYESVCDVPYANLDYEVYGGEGVEEGRHGLTKDGVPWVAPPGADQFGDICFSDGHNLYIQCFLTYYDKPSTDFRWFAVNLNHFDDEDSVFLPDETMNQLFVGADGDTLYTADGYEYKLSAVSWCQDGTCKR